MSKFEQLIEKLDLQSHLEALASLFAREKSIILQGDRGLHFKFITALDSFELPSLPELKNLDDELIRLSKEATLSLDEIYEFVKIIEFFNKLKAMSLPPIWSEFVSSIEIPREVLEIVSFFNDEGKLDSAKIEELFEVEQALKNIKSQKRENLRNIANSRRLNEYLVDSNVHLYYGQEALLARGGFSSAIKASVIGRSSGGYFYIVPDSLTKLEQLESQLLDKQEQIYRKYAKLFSGTMHKWLRFLEFINKSFDRVDHYIARAIFLRKNDLELILPNKSKTIRLSSFKHPAIKDCKPIDIEFSKKIMLITGVNAGGKTMLLKSLLSSVLMSKYLIPFACNETQTKIGSFSFLEAILDDPQSVKNDISTFAGRMVEFRKLFKLKDALVGVDEIELGTDADEAAALFRSLLEELSKKDIYFIITTQHKRLASLMASNEDVELVAAIYDEAKQEPTYTYLKGSIGKSYAFETALRYGIDEQVVAKAREYLGEDKEQLSQLIEQSTQLEITMREKIKEAEEKLERANQKEQKLDNLKERLLQEQKEKLSSLEKQYQSSLKLVQEALKKAENPDARRLLNEAYKAKSKAAIEREKTANFELSKGQRVEYRGKEAIILSLKSKEAFIDVNGMKLRVNKSELKPLQKPKKIKAKQPTISVKAAKPQKSSLTLKLLGKRADEAIEETQQFISDALMHGFSEVEIIHGTGSGVLVKVISDLLKKHPKVKSFERVKGNLGATIVKL